MSFFCALCCFAAAFFSLPVYAKGLPASPACPSVGVGGSCYFHKGLSKWQRGLCKDKYEVFEPAGPELKKAGFVLLLHDFFAYSPEFYSELISHLCRRGWVVVFPHYQGMGEVQRDFLPNIVRSVKDFLMYKFKQGKLSIDTDKFIIIGHGAGAVLAANTAASADYFGLKAPQFIFIVTPSSLGARLLDLSGISPRSQMLVIAGDKEKAGNFQLAREIFYAADRVKTENKVFITVLSDYNIQPPLIADERVGLSGENKPSERVVVARRNEFIRLFRSKAAAYELRGQPTDVFERYVLFKAFDVLTSPQAKTAPKMSIFLKSSEMRSIGHASDGRRLKGIIATDRP